MTTYSGSFTDSGWLDYIFALNPSRMQSGYAGAFFSFTPGMIANTVELLSNNSLVARHLRQDESPDDILPLIGAESGIIKFYNETNDSFRERILNKWDTTPYYGRENTLTSSLYTVGDSNFVSVSLDFNLGGTDIAIGPTTPSGSIIPPYPPTSQNVYQFNVIVTIGSITAGSGDTESLMIPDKQLNSIRRVVKLMKPVDFACREILLFWYSGSIGPSWGDSVTDWDDGTTWLSAAPSASLFRFERHRGY